MTPEFYASLRTIILRDMAAMRQKLRDTPDGDRPSLALFADAQRYRHRQRDLARLRALRAGTADTL
jgi:hypothetical protein